MEKLHPLSSLLSPTDMAKASQLARDSGDPIDIVATRLGLCSEIDLVTRLSETAHVEIARAGDFPDDSLFDGLLNATYLQTARTIPISDDGSTATFAMANPLDLQTIEGLSLALRKPITVRVATSSDIEAAWLRLYDTNDRENSDESVGKVDFSDDVDRLRDMASEAPVIRYVNQLIGKAVELNASDIHLEPLANRLRVRLRLDGRLREIEDPPTSSQTAIISRLKIMGRLNIAERRLAQDGRFRIAMRGMDIDLRIATTPTLHGEAIVLRILDSGQVELDLTKLGLVGTLASEWRRLLTMPHGIVLVTGPTGSGKTTTLYAGLKEINTIDRKIISIEDPIELQLDGINQVQAKPSIGLSFAQALRSFLRHDPDIILVGEIRDLETAQTAVQAALTGHLILSTLHTNDAASAITRLIDMGIDDYLLASTVHGILAQRLVRKLCLRCREISRPPVAPVGYETADFWVPVGCTACGGTGYSGRTMICELITISDPLRRLIMRRVSADDIRQQALHAGFKTLHSNGIDKAAQGITSIDEVLKACMEN